MLKLISGAPRIEYYTATASTQINNGTPVFLTSGAVAAATAASTPIAGILMVDRASTDASTPRIPVIIPTFDTVFEADVKWGVTPLATVEGAQVDIWVGPTTSDTTGKAYEQYIDTGATTHKMFTVVKVLTPGVASSSTNQGKVLVKVNNTSQNVSPA